MPPATDRLEDVTRALRAAGCVFAEEEAAILLEASSGGSELDRLVHARAEGAPLEQLVGWVEFAGLRLAVGPGVFVPRQRTGELVRAVLRELAGCEGAVFVEAFAGVAPIAAAVRAARPDVIAHAAEHDPVALAHARTNLGDPARAHASDVLAGLPAVLRGTVTVIAAVPPYVPLRDAGLLPREARDHEPASALFGGVDGLALARRLIEQAGTWLITHGVLLVEMHREQAREAALLGERVGFGASVEVADDGQTATLRLARR